MVEYTSQVVLGDHKIVFSTTNEKDFDAVKALVESLVNLISVVNDTSIISNKQEESK